jgi:hypothetical protein
MVGDSIVVEDQRGFVGLVAALWLQQAVAKLQYNSSDSDSDAGLMSW